jgi:hypothetical protein
MPTRPKRKATSATDVEEVRHLFDQTNGMLGEDSSPDRVTSAETDAQRARGAALGATMPAGWGR